MASVFRGTLAFFRDLGIYDVILPFLLVFTIVFAILEKTQIFGTEEVEGEEYTKKNLNAMFAFVTSFLVVGSAQLVSVINEVVANIVLLLLLSISFLILAGSFHKDEEFFLESGWNKTFMIIMFVGVLLIFLHALGWLQYVYNYVTLYWNSVTVASIILMALVIGLMVWMTRTPKPSGGEES